MGGFRNIPMSRKVKLTVVIPVQVDEAIRGIRGRRSLSEFVTVALCRRLNLDPVAFGIDPAPYERDRRRRRPPEAEAATA